MKRKFKIGDEAFFMKGATPTKSKVKGVLSIVGELLLPPATKKVGTEEKPDISYCFEDNSLVPEVNCFTTKEEMQEHLFAKL